MQCADLIPKLTEFSEEELLSFVATILLRSRSFMTPNDTNELEAVNSELQLRMIREYGLTSDREWN